MHFQASPPSPQHLSAMSPSPGLRLPIAQPQPLADAVFDGNSSTDRSSSPPAPPYSPITPVMTTSDLAASNGDFGDVRPEGSLQPPPPMPFSESDNADAMALRSAISILQIQRQQALRDMKALEEEKKLAVANPEDFADAVAAGQIKTTRSGALFVGPHPDRPQRATSDLQDDMDIDGDVEGKPIPQKLEFGDFPGAQNVVRCPPVNWAKYHIVGESLDKLHEEQRARPAPGQPHADMESERAPQHVIAAPYNPWTDILPESSMRTRGLAKKEG